MFPHADQRPDGRRPHACAPVSSRWEHQRTGRSGRASTRIRVRGTWEIPSRLHLHAAPATSAAAPTRATAAARAAARRTGQGPEVARGRRREGRHTAREGRRVKSTRSRKPDGILAGVLVGRREFGRPLLLETEQHSHGSSRSVTSIISTGPTERRSAPRGDCTIAIRSASARRMCSSSPRRWSRSSAPAAISGTLDTSTTPMIPTASPTTNSTSGSGPPKDRISSTIALTNTASTPRSSTAITATLPPTVPGHLSPASVTRLPSAVWNAVTSSPNSLSFPDSIRTAPGTRPTVRSRERRSSEGRLAPGRAVHVPGELVLTASGAGGRKGRVCWL